MEKYEETLGKMSPSIFFAKKNQCSAELTARIGGTLSFEPIALNDVILCFYTHSGRVKYFDLVTFLYQKNQS